MDIIELNGSHLSFEQFEQIVKQNAFVKLEQEALVRVRSARALIYELDKRGEKVYGLNTGVGWNKDRKVEAEYFDTYNKSLLRSHCIGIAPECCEAEIRGTLLIRLNGILSGHTGVSEKIVLYLAEFLNRGIHPVIRKRGSVGAGDIGTLSDIGMVMIGEGEAYFQGERLSGAIALKKAELSPIVLGPKDGLGIVSSNAGSASQAGVFILEAAHFLKVSHLVFCLSLEALNGITAPYNETVNKLRGYNGQIISARLCREFLDGSYLYEPDLDRALQDPLSFRDYCAVTGGVLDAFHYVKGQLLTEMNTTCDNPCLIPEEDRISCSANFEPLAWVLGIEMFTLGLGHVSKMTASRLIKLANPQFTGLSRFLAPNEEQVIAFSTIQKAIGALDAENRMYVNPSSMDYLELAGGIEDHATNASLAVEKARKLLDNLYYMAGIELMHGAQAMDLRNREKASGIKLGSGTSKLYTDFRKKITFLEEDRNLSIDIGKSYEFLKSYDLSVIESKTLGEI